MSFWFIDQFDYFVNPTTIPVMDFIGFSCMQENDIWYIWYVIVHITQRQYLPIIQTEDYITVQN